MTKKYGATAQLFKALGDEHRLQILDLLREGDKCGCELLKTLEISQPTLSHHMKILCETGVVASHRTGKCTVYSIHMEGCTAAKKMLREFTDHCDAAKKTE